MKNLKTNAPALALAMLALGLAAPAHADPCGPFLARLFADVDAQTGYYDASGTRVTVRPFWFTSLALNPAYRASDGISTPAQSNRRQFDLIGPVGGDVQGPFREVFTDRADGVTDPGVLWLRRDGRVQIGSATLSQLQCYQNPVDADSFLLTGMRHIAGYERSIWTFFIVRSDPVI
jgi:hypothetical protein